MSDSPPKSDAAYAVTVLAWLALLVSLFVRRADATFYDVPANLLYQYQPFGAILIAVLIALVPLTMRALRGSSRAGLAVTALWLVATAATVWAGLHIGTHATDMGDMKNDVAEGTILAIAAAALGLLAALMANLVFDRPKLT